MENKIDDVNILKILGLKNVPSTEKARKSIITIIRSAGVLMYNIMVKNDNTVLDLYARNRFSLSSTETSAVVQKVHEYISLFLNFL